MWMNEYDIDRAKDILTEYAPEAAKFAVFLSDYKDQINSMSDGWAHWPAGARPANRLSDLLSKAVDSVQGRGDMPSEAEFMKALSPMRAAATRHKFKAPELKEIAASTRPRM